MDQAILPFIKPAKEMHLGINRVSLSLILA